MQTSTILQSSLNSKHPKLKVVPRQLEANKFVIEAIVGPNHNWLAAIHVNGELLEEQQLRVVELMAAGPALRAALVGAHDQLAVMLGGGNAKVRELRVLLDKTPAVA